MLKRRPGDRRPALQLTPKRPNMLFGVSVPSKATAYFLTSEQIAGQQSARARGVALSKLRWLGVQVYAGTDGIVRGQIQVDPRRFDPFEPARIAPLQRFEAIGPDRLHISPPEPLSQLGPVLFIDAQSHEELVARLAVGWRELVQRTRGALSVARTLSPDARLELDPWRIEGSLAVFGHAVRLLFSSRGDRACISAVDGRPVISQATSGRVILPVAGPPDARESEERWRAALEQAKACLGLVEPVVTPTREEESLSIDLLSRDLDPCSSDTLQLEATTPPQSAPRALSAAPGAGRREPRAPSDPAGRLASPERSPARGPERFPAGGGERFPAGGGERFPAGGGERFPATDPERFPSAASERFPATSSERFPERRSLRAPRALPADLPPRLRTGEALSLDLSSSDLP